MSKRQLPEDDKNKKFRSSFLKEAWLLVENVNCDDSNGSRFEMVCVEPKLATKEGHQLAPGSWLYIQPDGKGTPRLVKVRNLSRGKIVIQRDKKIHEKNRNTWFTEEELARKPNVAGLSICKTSKYSIRDAKRALRKNAARLGMEYSRKVAAHDFVLAKRRRSNRTRQFDGAGPSGSGAQRSRQLLTPTPPPGALPQNKSVVVESSYSSDNVLASSTSADESPPQKHSDGAVPSSGGVPRSKQVVKRSTPPSTRPNNSTVVDESSYSSDNVLASSTSTDEPPPQKNSDGAVPSTGGVPRSKQPVKRSTPPSTRPNNSTVVDESSYSSDNVLASSTSTDEGEKFKRLVKSIAKYSQQIGKRSEKTTQRSRRSTQRAHQHHRRRLVMSTPVPGCSCTQKLTFDQATQTEEMDESQDDEEQEMEEVEEGQESDDQEMEEQESDDQDMEDQEGEEQEEDQDEDEQNAEVQDAEVQDSDEQDAEEQVEEEEEEDPEFLKGVAALKKMGTLIETIATQFNTLTDSMGREDLRLVLSDIGSDSSESESESDMNDEPQLNQSGEMDSSPPASPPPASPRPVSPPPEPPAVVENLPPEPVRRVSPPVQADASPSVRRVPTPQQPVVGVVEQASGERQSSNESGEHFVTTSNIMGPGPSGQRMVKVRRVSAHTTNRIERGPGEDLVPIGNGRAMVPSRLLEEIDWNSYTQATRQLLQAVFPRRVLATHSLTGKPSPAFMNKPPKKRLNPQLVEDVVIVVVLRCGVTERLVRNCITIKCTDEAKLYRNRQQCRQGRLQSSDQENVPPNQTTDETTETSSGDS